MSNKGAWTYRRGLTFSLKEAFVVWGIVSSVPITIGLIGLWGGWAPAFALGGLLIGGPVGLLMIIPAWIGALDYRP